MFDRLRIRHRIRHARDVTRDTPEGEITRATGVVCAVEPVVTSLLVEQPCVAYRVRATSAGKAEHVSSHQESVVLTRFAIDRGAAGHVIVDGTHALFDLTSVALPHGIDDRIEHVRLLFGFQALAVSVAESIVSVGATVSVVGVLVYDPTADLGEGEHGFRDELDPVQRLTGDYDHPLLIGEVD
jgi:hypothetical protein